jgi:hypothetical protein
MYKTLEIITMKVHFLIIGCLRLIENVENLYTNGVS